MLIRHLIGLISYSGLFAEGVASGVVCLFLPRSNGFDLFFTMWSITDLVTLVREQCKSLCSWSESAQLNLICLWHERWATVVNLIIAYRRYWMILRHFSVVRQEMRWWHEMERKIREEDRKNGSLRKRKSATSVLRTTKPDLSRRWLIDQDETRSDNLYKRRLLSWTLRRDQSSSWDIIIW